MTATGCTASTRALKTALVVLTVVVVVVVVVVVALLTTSTSQPPASAVLRGSSQAAEAHRTATTAAATTASSNASLNNSNNSGSSGRSRATPQAQDSRQSASLADKAPVNTRLSGRMQFNLLVVPEHKLMWCRIDKVAGSTTANVINLVRARHPSTPPDAATFLLTGHSSPRIQAIMDASHADRRFTRIWRRTTVGSPILDIKSTHELAHLMADPEWTKVVVFRDPVERFLSAFISKCEPHHDPVGNCVYAPRGQGHASFPHFVAAARNDIAKNRRTGDTASVFKNIHWAKQSTYCGGLTSRSGLPFYNVRAQYSSHTFGGVVEDALQRAGVPAEVRDEVQVKVLGDPNHGLARKGNATHTTNAGSKLCKYFRSEEEVAEVASWYAEDYRAFAPLGLKSGVEYYREVCKTF